MPAGRPTDYNDGIAQRICDFLEQRYPLTEICRMDDMPVQTTVYRWLRQHEEFRQRYARAREIQAESWADEIVEIANDGRNDWTERQVAPGVVRHMPDQEVVNRSKLRVDTLKWLMSKQLPKKYGDKTVTEHTGGDKPVTIVVDTGIKRKRDED